MVEDKISSYVDLQATAKETDTLLDQLDSVLQKINEVNAVKITLSGASKSRDIVNAAKAAGAAMEDLSNKVEQVKKADEEIVKASKELIAASTREARANNAVSQSFDELIKSQVENQRASQELRQERKLLDKAYQEGKISNERYQHSLEEIAKAEVALKVSNNDLARALRNMEKEAQASDGSLNELRAKLNLSLQAFDRLSESEKNSDLGKAIKGNIDALTKSISQQEQSTGRFQRNVGNYSGALRTLERALDGVKRRIEDYTQSGNKNADVLEQLQREEKLIEQLLNAQISGFASVTAEIKANTVALQQMAAAGLEGTEAYNKLFEQTAALKDEAADLKAALSAAAPDDLAFTAAADAAKALIGIYGLAQSAAALFGVENEALQETLVKLQAAETALQSIEAIRAVFKKENAVRQAINIALQKVEILHTNLQTAAESKNIVVRYAAIAAQKALNVVMSAAGGPVLVIIGLLTALAVTLSTFSSSSDKAARDFKKLNDEFKGFEALLNDRIAIIKRNGAVTIAELQKQFASERQIREVSRKSLVEESGELKRFLADNGRAYWEAFDISTTLTVRQRAGEELSKKEKEKLNDAITFVDNYISVRNRSEELETQIEVTRLNNLKENVEEEIKIRQEGLEISKLEFSRRLKEQNDIVSNDEKSYEDRLTALRRFINLQQAIINNDLRQQLMDPTLKNDPRRRELLEKQAQDAISDAEREGQKQRVALLKERASRERAAQFEIAKIAIQAQADAAQQLADNENKSIGERLEAAKRFFEIQKSLISAQRDFDLNNAKLLESERKVITDRARAEELNAQKEFLEKSYQISLAALDKDRQIALANSNKRRDDYIRNLNEQFQDGLITQEQYNKKRLEAEYRYANDEINVTISFLEEEIEKRKQHGENVAVLEAALAKLRADLSDKTTEKIIADEEKLFQARLKKLDTYKQLVNNVFATFGELVALASDREIAQIEDQIAAIDKKKAADIEYANNNITNEQDRAAAISVIEARANAQREALERKRKQAEIEKARFEKFSSIARIISDTAIAIVTTLGDKTIQPGFLRIPLAATIGALGAAQLARVIATPLPKYAEGTEDHPGGPAVVGDGGKRELVVTPDGKLFITNRVPQILDLPEHSIVFPDAEEILETVFNSNHSKTARIQHSYNDVENTRIISAFNKGTREIVRTIKEKQELHVQGTHAGVMMIHKYGQDYWEYIEEQVNF